MIFLIILFCELEFPPLPQPLEIEIRPIQPERMRIPLDSLSISFYLLNPYGGLFRLSKGTKRYLFDIDFGINNGEDYSSYSQTHFGIGGGNITPKRWFGGDMDYKRESRDGHTLQHLKFSTSPLFYSLYGDFYLHSDLILTDSPNYRFTTISGRGVWESPGYWVLSSSPLYQETHPFLPISLSFKISAPPLFLRPELSYEIFNSRPSLSTRLIFLKTPVLFNMRLTLNRENPILFDTLYSPLSELGEEIEYPVERIVFQIGARVRSLHLSFSKGSIQSFLFWDDKDKDSLLEPHNLNTTREEWNLSHNLEISCFKNYLSLTYKKFNPMPSMVADVNILDSLIFKKENLSLGLSYKYTGRQGIQNHSIDPYYTISLFSGYRRGIVYLYLEVDNLLGKRYEALPYRFDKGRKYSLGLELAKHLR